MKILLDENLDHRLRNQLGNHEVFTASYMGWDGLKNGKLIRAAEDNGFDLLLTGDQTLCYEQNLSGRRLAVIDLSAVEWRIVKNHISRIITAIDNASPGSFQTVDCGVFSRKSGSEE
jgi:alkanesulfonate monooxygenase SsuD/methylene tetrahydromethanopterin reductase-like flavin-dependent oxidoreductase (luciferase family)